jgi:hypothetical protein
MTVEIFKDRIADLGRHLQIDALAINEANVCNIGLEDGSWLHVSFADVDDQVHWTAVIRGIAGVDKSRILPGLLAANLEWGLMKGTYFAFDDLVEVVLLRYHEPAGNLHAQRFIELTDRFAGVAQFWRERLAAQIERMTNPKAALADPAASAAAALLQQRI